MKIIAVVDTAWMGHIPSYHKMILNSLLLQGHQVISISPKPQEISEWIDSKSLDFKNRLSLRIFVSSKALEPGALCMATTWWRDVRNSLREFTPDLVFLPGIEVNIVSQRLTGLMVDEIFPFKWTGLYLTPKYLRKGIFKFWHKRLTRKDRFFDAENCVGISVLDEGVVPRLQSIMPTKHILVMPDVSFLEKAESTGELEEKIIRKANGRKIIGLFGEMSKRKGILNFLATAELAEKKSLPWFFILIGPLNHRNNRPHELNLLKSAIASTPSNVFMHLDRVANEEEFNRLFSICDVIFAVYEKFYHSSNALTKAAFFKIPILVAKGFCMAERVGKFKLGTSVPEQNPIKAVQGIKLLLSREKNSAKNLEKFSSLHSLESLNTFFKNLVDLI